MSEKLNKTRDKLLTSKIGDGRLFFHPILMMHAAKMYKRSYTDFMTDYHVLVDSNLHLLELYDHDAVSVISDPYREASAFGMRLDFDGDKFPISYPFISSMADVDKLKIPNVYDNERTLDRIKGVELFRQKLGSPFPIIGWVEGPLAEAADLMGLSNILLDLMLEPDKIHLLLQKTLHVAKDFALAQIKAGCDVIGIGDAICSQISSDLYMDFCYPLHRDLIDYIHSFGVLVKLHICGNITHLLPQLSQLDIDILDIDWMVDMPSAGKIMGDDVMLCGNIDPVSIVLEGSDDQVLSKFEELKNTLPLKNWIFMAGCEIPKDTLPERMRFLRKISYIS